MGRRIRRVPALPFVKWAGGKRALVPELMKHVPDEFGTYYEPFVGGGALFFALASERTPRYRNGAFLTDVNDRLIRTYAAIMRDSQKVVEQLREHAKKDGKRYYDAQRERDIDRCTDAAVAAWLIYLNRVCFNGLYRVNKKGMFNVPRGRYENPQIVNERNLVRCAMALQDATVGVKPFTWVTRASGAKRGDFVYFDPPYYPTSKTSNFASYAKDGFADKDHEELRDVALHLKSIGAHVLISNSSADRVRELYATGFTIHEVQAARAINSKGEKRGKVTDLLIT